MGTVDRVTDRPFATRMTPEGFDRLLATVLTVLLAAGLGIAWWSDRHEQIEAMEYVKAATQLTGTMSLWFRRRHPVAVVVLCTALSIPEQVVALPFATYAVALFVEDRRRVYTIVLPVAILWARPWDFTSTSDMIATALLALAPALYGLYTASRRRLIAALAERAERAEREQELRAEQARSEERARLAGEMHDVVTHRVSLMVLQAGALRTRTSDDETREGLESLRLVGCEALEELRDLVTILRTEDKFGSALTAEPTALDLSSLVAESRAAGVEVDLDAEGDPPVASPVVVRTAYRIVQESLTNVHKHAPGARVSVRVRHSDGWLRLNVANTPPTGPYEISVAGEGTGLTGLRQRVEMVDGALRASPTGDGGFEVAADLPLGLPAGETSSGAASAGAK